MTLPRVIRAGICAVIGHQYVVVRRLSLYARKVKCSRCGTHWGMHDQTRSLIEWDDELEAVYSPEGPLGNHTTNVASRQEVRNMEYMESKMQDQIEGAQSEYEHYLRLLELEKLLDSKFTSGNAVAVERIVITRTEYEALLKEPR